MTLRCDSSIGRASEQFRVRHVGFSHSFWGTCVLAPTAVPYCGLPVDPRELLGHWNLDPVLIASLGLLLVGYEVTFKSFPLRMRGRFVAGWTLAAFALISP